MSNDVRATNGLSSWLAYSINPPPIDNSFAPSDVGQRSARADGRSRSPLRRNGGLFWPRRRGKQAVQVEVGADDILPEARAREEEFFGGASIAELSSLPLLTSSAARSSSGEEVIVSATNRHLEDEVRVEINLKNSVELSSGEVSFLASANVRDHNSSERPELVSPISSKVEDMYNKLTYTLAPHSAGAFQLRL